MTVESINISLLAYFQKFSSTIPLNTEMLEAIKSFKKMVLKKNEILVNENEVCNYFCFVESGILQHAIVVLEEEKTTYIALKNSVTTSLNSFLNGVPSRKSVKALVNTELWVLDLNTFNDLIQNNQSFHNYYFNLIERQICLIDDYRIDLLTLTPEERYLKLLKNETKLLNEVPLHYLASFLGISNRHMSRIRKTVLNNS